MRVHHCARLCPHASTHELLLANHLCDLRQLLSYNRLAYAPDPPRACIKSQQEVFAKLIISRCIKKKYISWKEDSRARFIRYHNPTDLLYLERSKFENEKDRKFQQFPKEFYLVFENFEKGIVKLIRKISFFLRRSILIQELLRNSARKRSRSRKVYKDRNDGLSIRTGLFIRSSSMTLEKERDS